MTGARLFSGGWLDLPGLLLHLGGRPLQAEWEEVFTPRSGGDPLRRSGRVYVDGRKRVRVDVLEPGAAPVMFCFDPATRSFVAGVIDQPDTWRRASWPMSFDSPPNDGQGAGAGVAFRSEYTDAEGSYVCRLFNDRYEEPAPTLFA